MKHIFGSCFYSIMAILNYLAFHYSRVDWRQMADEMMKRKVNPEWVDMTLYEVIYMVNLFVFGVLAIFHLIQFIRKSRA